MRILVTGASGFIGGSFARLAAARGHNLAALIRPGQATPTIPGDVSWLAGTLAEAPWPEIAAFHPELCVHAAWITTPGVYLESPENEILAQWSREFVRRAARAGVRRVVALGTCLEYQMSGNDLAESNTPLAPAFPYARCKDTLRRWLEADGAQFGFSLCWGRVFYPYGPGEHSARLCSALAQKLLQGERVVLKTPDSAKDYIFIDDLAAALLAVVEHEVSGAINLGTGLGVTVRRLGETLEELLGRSGLVGIADPPQPDPLPRVIADATLVRGLGWSPQVPLRQGLSQLIQHLRS